MQLPTHAALLAILTAALGSTVFAQVDCSVPDNLCTGDPCVIPSLRVVSPCVVDFGARTVVVQGPLVVPGAGTLSLTAASLSIDGTIDGRDRNIGPGAGADVTLSASNDITVSGRVKVGGEPGGTITLQAGGNVTLDGPLQSPGLHKNIAGAVTVEAGGMLLVRAPVQVRGKAGAGEVTLRGATGVSLQSTILANGFFGVQGVEVSSAMGDVTIDATIRTEGGTVTVSANGAVTINAGIRAAGQLGGSIQVSSSAGDVNLNDRLDARGRILDGGSIVIDSGADANILGGAWAGGVGPPGFIDISAAAAVVIGPGASLDVQGFVPRFPQSLDVGRGGMIHVGGASAQIAAGAKLLADGETMGGMVDLGAASGNLVLEGDFRARGGAGVIEGVASGDLTADGDFRCAPDGCIGLSAGGTLDTSGGSFDKTVVASCP